MPYEFKLTRQVEFSETDMAGIAHFTNFFRFMEAAEHAFFREGEPGAAEMRRVRDRLRTWDIPALVMFSDGDPVFRPEVGQAFANLLPGAHGVMDTITGAAHMLQEDKGEEIADRILDWVGAAPAG